MVLRDEPLLRWSNPLVGEIYGGVFLWTHDGRPEVIAAIFKWYSPLTHMTHEFHSLSPHEITAGKGDEVVWETSEPGLKLAAVPDAPVPGKTPAQRLSQMRRIAQRFAARKTDREGVTRELRLLTQPVYRYESTGANSGDGALFAFVEGTDPELFLLIESQGSGSEARWSYGIARMNFEPLVVSLDEDEVWSAGLLPSAEIYGHRGVYTKFHIRMP